MKKESNHFKFVRFLFIFYDHFAGVARTCVEGAILMKNERNKPTNRMHPRTPKERA